MDESHANKPIDGCNTDHEAESQQDSVLNLKWQILPISEDIITNSGWEQHDLPAAVHTFPEHINIGVQLQNLLSWSLFRNDAADPNDKLSLTTDSNQPRQDSEAPEDTAQEPDARSQEDVLSISARTEGSISASIKGSMKGKQVLSRLKQLQQEVGAKVATKSQNLSRAKSTRRTATVQAPPQKGECISCFDEFSKSELVHLECSHEYCKLCLREVVLNAAKVESAFPPKCCLTEIPRKTALLCLDKSQRELYKEKAAEYAIPAGHRWYCPEPSCAKWIQPEKLHRDRRAEQTCPHCKHKFCSICRNIAHDQNADCPEDFGLGSTLEVAESEGWRRCYSCRTMVELTTGCRHITCRCGAEFCYVCNARWRTCACTEADKDRRMRELQARRAERENRRQEDEQRQQEEDAAAQAEAEELAEAIAQIEEFERQEAIRLAEEERVRQLEEELALAKLEEERLLEEIARREAEEEAARQLREALLSSSREECEAMAVALFQIIEHQHTMLMSEHDSQGSAQVKAMDEHRAAVIFENTKWETWLDENIEKRRKWLQARQQMEREELIKQAEEEEDEMFMQMHMYLRDKPNREQREKRMRDTFQAQQTQKQDAMQQRHDHGKQKLEHLIQYEMEGLRKATSSKLEAIEERVLGLSKQLGHSIGCERQVFQLICRHRIEMLKEHTRLVYVQLEAEQEPVGLTEQQARNIQPMLPSHEPARMEQIEGLPSGAGDEPTAITNRQSYTVESSDLYASATPQQSPRTQPSDMSVADTMKTVPSSNDLTRSSTVSRPIPGAYPALSVYSQSVNPAERQISTSSTGFVSVGALGMFSSIPAYEYQLSESHDSSRLQQPTQIVPETEAIAELPSPTTFLSATNHRTSNTSTGSSVSTAPTETGSQSDVRRGSSRTSISAGSEANVAAAGVRLSSGGIGNKAAKKGFFSKFAKKELTEEEIRRRMVATVGDGFGA